jgi:hypothetical protein
MKILNYLSPNGMNIMEDNIENIRSKDPIDILIYEKGLRIKTVMIDKELDIMVMVLNNGKIIKSAISIFPGLKSASQKQLEEYRLISSGVGIHWEKLDEDLSLKGFIRDAAINSMIKHLQAKEDEEHILA